MSEPARPGIDPSIRPVTIGADFPPQLPLAFGGSWFVAYSAPGEEDVRLRGAIDAAYDSGVRHFDTAGGYGEGHSEEIYGAFLAGKRSEIFLASKANPAQATAAAMAAEVDASLRRLRTDHIDLYYIHWPQRGVDMRPRMEALEAARRQGKIGAVGVSNFSVDQMRQVQEVGRIDAHQLGYNLLWRYAEDDLVPFCVEHDIAVVTYSSIAHGILTGKFDKVPDLAPGDQRHRILPFRSDIWPHVHAGVEQLKAIAAELDRPLMHLAIRWNLARPGIRSVVVGARNRAQSEANAAALSGAIPSSVFERMTAISDEIVRHVPNEGNLFNHHP
ncbi:aldo/keto reductase [Labrys wisconsinensis]|uniref:Aryl-alcohol dehydrogenase-like predicted oxidoreductase n=1 Tax=Labrys wisconsinensis TaxID=425677 RepID=A0ABU0JKC1_9HYPH|nr:aldo/keto reductase [Labrys wisconsinensis]MDQ0474746.1 aryl-alcohol dehydrogenase-like predicted oxidoreductase [Labrys wisconsinensis]